MDVVEQMARTWLVDLFRRDPAAICAGVALMIVGSLATSIGAKLGRRAAFSLGKLAWSGAKWLTTPKPPGELAAAILSEIAKHEPHDDGGHTVWYGQRLHFYCGDTTAAYIDKTPVDQLLSRAERRRILRSVRHARRCFAERKVRELQSEQRPIGTGGIVRVDVT